MATKQGICKNCGSLIMFDDKKDTCECIFCNCEFEAELAVKLLENSEGHEFKNETFERKAGTHNYVVPTYADVVASAVAVDKAKNPSESKTETTLFEITPKDVKAPKKTVAVIIGIVAIVIILIIAISLPIYKTRTAMTKELRDRIPTIVEGIISVDTTIDEDGNSVGYYIAGTTCQDIRFVTDDDVTDDEATRLFTNYCEARDEANEADMNADDVRMRIYCMDGVIDVSSDDGQILVEVNDNYNPAETTTAAEEE